MGRDIKYNASAFREYFKKDIGKDIGMIKKLLYIFSDNHLMAKLAIVTLSLLFSVSPALADKESAVISGDSIQRVLSTKDNILRTVEVENKITKRTLSVIGPEFVIIWGDGQKLTSDDFKVISLDSKEHGLIAVLINDAHGIKAEITYSTAANSPWLYKQIFFTNTGIKPFLFRSVELEHLKINDEKITYAVNAKFPELSDWGQPVYTESLWFGIEFPATRSSVTSDGFIFLRHHPGIELAVGQSYFTKRSVLGVAASGKVKNISWIT